MDFFVNRHSIVRKICSKSDTILFIFAGASENKFEKKNSGIKPQLTLRPIAESLNKKSPSINKLTRAFGY